MLSTLIDFLMNLLRNDDAKAAFSQNPQAELAKNGLEGVTGQDVRDARLIMADNGGARPRDDGSRQDGTRSDGHRSDGHRPSSRGDDPVHEIDQTTQHYEVVEQHTVNNVNVVSIDDRDTVIIDDSFNSDNDTNVDVTAVQDNSTHTDIDVVQVGDHKDPKDPNDPEDSEKPVDPVDPVDRPVEPEPVDTAPVDTVPVEDGPVQIDPVPIDPVDDLPVDIDPVEDQPEPELADTLVG